MIDTELRSLVRRRARNRCEYCGLHQDHDPVHRFHVEHIVPRKHGGGDEADNLALACHLCNLFKGPNLSGIDPQSGRTVRLFHPRRQRWERHFRWDDLRLVGRTMAGRASIAVLRINHPDRVALRAELMAEHLFPPGRWIPIA